MSEIPVYLYAVVENGGTDDERVVRRFERYLDAVGYLRLRAWGWDKLAKADIMKYTSDGTLTNEF
jgi:hypothetical protein